MDHIDAAVLAEVLEQASSAAAGEDFLSLVGVASALRSTARGEDEPVRALIAGLEYRLILDDDDRALQGPFGPMSEMDGKSYPVPLGEIEEVVPGVYALWERVIALAPLALVRARFADLLWEARYGDRPHEFAHVAIDATSKPLKGPLATP